MKTKFMNIVNSKWIKWLLLVAVALSAFFIFQESKVESVQVYTVTGRDVSQAVLLSGSVRAVGQVDLSFDAPGKIASIEAKQGDEVLKGDVLAKLNYGILEADLLQAQGNLQSAQSDVLLAKASVKKAGANLDLVLAQNRGTDSSIVAATTELLNTTNEQATLVQNAYLELINNDLAVYPTNSGQNVPAPIVSGNYTGGFFGEYTLNFFRSAANTGYSLNSYGLENSSIDFGDYGIPFSLGKNGLYITLPESGDGQFYGNTNWVIPIPNDRSTTYQPKLSAYEKAKQSQIIAIANAQAKLDTLIAQQASGESVAITTAQEQLAIATLEEARAKLDQTLGKLTQAEAGVARVYAQIENNIIVAPFDGTIARSSFEIGQSVTAGYAGITLVTKDEYELSMNISEIDVSKIKVGDSAEIILDAYGTEVTWSGILTEIELVETEIDGVPSYSSVITVVEPDDKIKIGMNARARIIVQEKENVIAIPLAYITNSGNIKTVLIKNTNDQTEERVVVTGLLGTNFFVEITEGLSVGDIILMPNKK